MSPMSTTSGRPREGSGTPEPFPGTEGLDPSLVFGRPGYNAPVPRTDPVAAVALVTALLSFIPGVGVIAAGTGAWALRRLRRSWDTGLTQAWTGVVVGSAATAAWLWAWWLISYATR
ncbi:DUF4190 domain-containing protein [Actinomyces radicidentis]|uniref:DUF4190 domain-containing protein n=1 Tax=Actinomyces radicidentis TaxID=111015 RepID=UPI0028E8C090|nr:DUF4190 domain-containing protein [Actinomyces radicidentis]